ncbi:undecaprenyldiphospho-muramoylpentapeptide beta-N-acetylglucosaminyltransferase [Candidatus Ichthyocystis hellenicum]|uniref:undecaprenyldiphospho-muramoylpentapeptide beta-N-acetylglucosaminyltransferase n=1 Tax=Candidatus Ichthyocystis hellenicum TaxID=1561003 RepID=UPI000ABF23EA|nr:undecaprenyldiphospho-muramoylpentapeptide beta-N-acetylglucosaminyltransferase [Candidatus Ichthyocystis hellenicum]
MSRICIIAGGTGGHIFPGLALANVFLQKGEKVFWLGNDFGMEYKIISESNIPFLSVNFRAVRNSGIFNWLKLPITLLFALYRSLSFLRQICPDLILGMGGYVCFPVYLAAFLLRIPFVIHEQNAIAGMANRICSPLARLRFCAFPEALPNSRHVGNPVRPEFLKEQEPCIRFKGREGALRVLVLGGSKGAVVLNQMIPKAANLLPLEKRPFIYHQTGLGREGTVKDAYGTYETVTVFEFTSNIIDIYRDVDFVICRAGAMTVTELTVLGLAALFIPYPYAVDNHQMMNAQFCVSAGAAYVLCQENLTAEWLSNFLSSLTRSQCLEMAERARGVSKIHATQDIVEECYRVLLPAS